MEFDSSTEVQEFISHVNQEIGMPDSETTGFSLMSDWPGEDDESGFYLFPSNKLCDVISTWTECLSDLGSTMHTRIIQLTYRKRLHFRSRRDQESDKEALLFAYQVLINGCGCLMGVVTNVYIVVIGYKYYCK